MWPSRVPDAGSTGGRRSTVVLVPTLARLGLAVLAAVIACLAVPATALAANGTVRPQQAAPMIAKALLPGNQPDASTPPAKTVTASYSCDFSHYGGPTSVPMPAAWEVDTSWPVNQPAEVLLATDAITLPSGVSLGNVTDFALSANVDVQKASAKTVTVSGGSVESLSTPLTKIPVMLAVGQVTFPAKGTGVVSLPAPTITITPQTTTAQAAITCTTTAKVQDISVTVGDATGSFYHCDITSGSASAVEAGLVAMTFSSSGTKKTGDSVTVSLSSADIATLAGSLNGVSGVTVTKALVDADLTVTGAQSGTLHMSKTVTDLTATSFSMSSSLKLTKAGTVKIDIPSKFGVGIYDSSTLLIDISCSLVTKPAPVALTLSVTQGSSSSGSGGACTTPSPTTTVTTTVTPTATVTTTVTPSPTMSGATTTVTPTVTVTPTTTVTPTVTVTPTTTPSPTPCASSGGSGGSSGSGGSEEGSGTPAGGVDTGGGVSPGANVALGIGGAALLLAGGGLVLRGGRRGALGRIGAGSIASWRRRLTRGR